MYEYFTLYVRICQKKIIEVSCTIPTIWRLSQFFLYTIMQERNLCKKLYDFI